MYGFIGRTIVMFVVLKGCDYVWERYVKPEFDKE